MRDLKYNHAIMLELKSFSLNLARLRNARGLTQDELSSKLGVSMRTLQRFEAGKFEPTLSVLVKLSLLFRVNIDDLIYFNMNDSYNYKRLNVDEMAEGLTRRGFVSFINKFKEAYDFKLPFLNFVTDYEDFRSSHLMLNSTNLIFTISNPACAKVLPEDFIMKRIIAGSTWNEKDAALTLMNQILRDKSEESYFQTTEMHNLEKMTKVTRIHYFYRDDKNNIYWFSCIESYQKQTSHEV